MLALLERHAPQAHDEGCNQAQSKATKRSSCVSRGMSQAVGRGWGAVVSACMQLTCIERHARKLHRRQPLGSTQLATKHLMREAIKYNQAQLAQAEVAPEA